MVFSLIIGSLIIMLNVVVQAYGNVWWFKKIAPSFKNDSKFQSSKVVLQLLIYSFVFFSILHFFQAWLWAFVYRLIPETSILFSSFSEAYYFSMVTFTSLGYGELTLSGDWRLLSGIEAINGIMLIGWSTAIMFSLIQKIFKRIN